MNVCREEKERDVRRKIWGRKNRKIIENNNKLNKISPLGEHWQKA